MATLDFKGKALVQNFHLTVPHHQLVPKKAQSLTDKVRLDDNLIVHGDNLKALKALLPTYAGRVKCIYIDPPYNTGNEGWAYNDNVNSPMMQEWLGKIVDRDDLTRHDKWLCMMTPRLKLLRELLRDDGAICVSIGEEEVANLRLLMDAIFGEENYRNTILTRRFDKNLSNQFLETGLKSMSIGAEYVLVYGRSENFLMNAVFREASLERQSTGYWKGFWNAPDRPTMRYRLLGVCPEVGQWKWKATVANEAVNNYETYLADFSGEMTLENYWNETGKTKRFIRRTSNLGGKNQGVEHWIPPSIGILRSSNWTDFLASETLTNIGLEFDNPKNVEVIKSLLKLCSDEEDIVLDSFGGSGTTAHAVLALNKADGGSRRFILVEGEDYADTLTAERVRRVIKGVKGASDEDLKNGLGGTFSYFKLGPRIETEGILTGKNLPSWLELARHVFFTATGEEFDTRKASEKRSFVGESRTHEVYLFYQPDLDYLRKTALTLERAEAFGEQRRDGKRRLVFAPTKYLDQGQLDALRVDFAQLPFEIYRLAR